MSFPQNQHALLLLLFFLTNNKSYYPYSWIKYEKEQNINKDHYILDAIDGWKKAGAICAALIDKALDKKGVKALYTKEEIDCPTEDCAPRE